MSNHYFQFKQFLINQGHSAMKVSTDACIQGAWTPVEDNVQSVLDIGTGTALLSLMLAQRFQNIEIDAIELDEKAIIDAGENIKASPWANRINLIHSDANNHNYGKQYDMIICNPPFFQNSLLGPSGERNLARHTLSFSYAHLLDIMNSVLAPQGYASVLLPYTEHKTWEALLNKNGWKIYHKCYIRPRANMDTNRVISLCRRGVQEHTRKEGLVIYNADNSYTETFSRLLTTFYLKL